MCPTQVFSSEYCEIFKGNVQFIFLCNSKKLSVNVCLMKKLKSAVTKKNELYVFTTLVKKTFESGGFCNISNFDTGFI